MDNLQEKTDKGEKKENMRTRDGDVLDFRTMEIFEKQAGPSMSKSWKEVKGVNSEGPSLPMMIKDRCQLLAT